jgi:hypothetical protein
MSATPILIFDPLASKGACCAKWWCDLIRLGTFSLDHNRTQDDDEETYGA